MRYPSAPSARVRGYDRLTHDYDLGHEEEIEIIHTLRASIANLSGMTERFAHFCQHHGLLPA